MDGLSRQEVEYRKNNGLANDEKIKYTRTTKEIVLSNCITLFNILNISLFILVLTTGSIQNTLFIGTILFNTIIAMCQELKAKKILDNIKVTDSDTVVVIRDGEKQTIKKEEIVLDDVVYISSGDYSAKKTIRYPDLDNREFEKIKNAKGAISLKDFTP